MSAEVEFMKVRICFVPSGSRPEILGAVPVLVQGWCVLNDSSGFVMSVSRLLE